MIRDIMQESQVNNLAIHIAAGIISNLEIVVAQIPYRRAASIFLIAGDQQDIDIRIIPGPSFSHRPPDNQSWKTRIIVQALNQPLHNPLMLFSHRSFLFCG